MALQEATLSKLIQDNLTAAGFAVGNPYSKIPLLADAIAKAVVSHIQASAVVTTPQGTGTVR